MRIRNFRLEDISALAQIQNASAEKDQRSALSEAEFANWIMSPELDATSNGFVITDDDDDLNTWGQAGTLEGIEGEIVGYTVLQVQQEKDANHILCQGTVHPEHRRRNGGRALIICALNRAHMLEADFESGAEQVDRAVYFEALFPRNDPSSVRLATKCEMQKVDVSVVDGLQLYRRIL